MPYFFTPAADAGTRSTQPDGGAPDAGTSDAGRDGGTDAGTPDAAVPDAGTPDACTPTSCSAQSASCGLVPDGCGGQLDCGTCSGGETCGGGGLANHCGSPVPSPSSVAGGENFSCAISPSGGLKCWGDNTYGQLGDGTNLPRPTPTPVAGGRDVTAVAAGLAHTCALLADAGVACWGQNSFGQLGDGTNLAHSQPVPVADLQGGAAFITAGAIHSCALTRTGGAKCWGNNGTGQLGIGAAPGPPTPTDVVGLSQGVLMISAGGQHTCAVVTGGTVKCWGDNVFGQLGDGTTGQSSTPVDVVGLTGVAAVVCGAAHTCALTHAGVVVCWGSNVGGELGIGMVGGNSPTPVVAQGLDGGVTALMPSGNFHTCATVGAGGLKCWGDNEGGQLGDGTKTLTGAPVDVIGLDSGVRAAAAGGAYFGHTCALLNDGGLQCWGQNGTGELGDGTTTAHLTPAPAVGF